MHPPAVYGKMYSAMISNFEREKPAPGKAKRYSRLKSVAWETVRERGV